MITFTRPYSSSSDKDHLKPLLRYVSLKNYEGFYTCMFIYTIHAHNIILGFGFQLFSTEFGCRPIFSVV